MKRRSRVRCADLLNVKAPWSSLRSEQSIYSLTAFLRRSVGAKSALHNAELVRSHAARGNERKSCPGNGKY